MGFNGNDSGYECGDNLLLCGVSMGDLSRNFSRREFECKCGCGFDDVAPILVERLQEIRSTFGVMKISSGCRCENHNRRVGGKNGKVKSAHVYGEAVDIVCETSRDRYYLVKLACEAGFNRIGVSDKFVHLDVSDYHPQNVMWTY